MDRPLILDEIDEVNWLLHGGLFVEYLGWRLDRYQHDEAANPTEIRLPGNLRRQYMEELEIGSRWNAKCGGSGAWHITFCGIPVTRGVADA